MTTTQSKEFKNITRLFNVIHDGLTCIGRLMDYNRTMEAIVKLCDVIQEHDNEDEDLWNTVGDGGAFMLGDLLVGGYWFFCDWNAGQGSQEDITRSVIGGIYSPGMSSGPEEDTGEQEAYQALEWIKREGEES